MSEKKFTVDIYTDGACSGNPGPGGWGAILECPALDYSKEISGGEHITTNNRMELTAVISALSELKKPCNVNLWTDSRYIVDAMTKGWAVRWKANGWMRNKKDKALNPDLWEKILYLCNVHSVT
ncbi:MAG: ribonuclease HI, partial [Oscillospiraceae bacterium]|nr:ribonuclease HI [Oscillospiraceae bacterium]